MSEVKDWGTAYEVFNSSHTYVSAFTMQENGRSSIHLHERLENLFFVLQGELVVEQFVLSAEGKLVNTDNVRLVRGNSYSVTAGVHHRMSTEVGCVGIEVYWPETAGGWYPDPHFDIVREDKR